MINYKIKKGLVCSFIVAVTLLFATHKAECSLIDDLIRDLKTGSQEDKLHAIQMLSGSGDEDSILPLVETLNDRDKMVQAYAMLGLEEFGKDAVKSLVKGLQHKKKRIRGNSARVLGNIADKRAFEPLLVALGKEKKSFVKKNIILSLNKIGDARAIPAITKLLKDKNSGVRRAAVSGLGEFKNESAIGSLITVIADSNPLVRDDAIRALGEIGGDSVAKKLIIALKFKDEKMRRALIEEVTNLSKKDKAIAKLATSALKHKDANVRSGVAKVLTGINYLPAVPFLIEALVDKEISVRINAAAALGNLNDKRAVGPVIGLLRDKSEEVRAEAASTLGKLKDWKSVKPLIESLIDYNANVRTAIVLALGEIGDKAALKSLERVTRKDKSEFVRNAAQTVYEELKNK